MKVGYVVLICEGCGAQCDVPPSGSKRTFMAAMNKFLRGHVWRCEWKFKPRRKPTPAEQRKKQLRRFSTYGATRQ